jgi:RNA polymerase sigma-70 factor (ECF subfamily)
MRPESTQFNDGVAESQWRLLNCCVFRRLATFSPLTPFKREGKSLNFAGGWISFRGVDGHATTHAVQRYLDELAGLKGDCPAEPIIKDLLASAVNRLHILCASLLYRNYPRLTQPPLNLETEEMLSAVVERLMAAMRQVHPQNVRQFFALANQHMRWELNDVARRLDERAPVVTLQEGAVPAIAESSGSELSQNARRMLAAIEDLPDDEREVFNLVRIQGLTQPETAALIGASLKTVQRRLSRGLIRLADELADLQPPVQEK